MAAGWALSLSGFLLEETVAGGGVEAEAAHCNGVTLEKLDHAASNRATALVRAFFHKLQQQQQSDSVTDDGGDVSDGDDVTDVADGKEEEEEEN
eukprot:7578941-Pyramimonas_sp.AAC.1